MDTLLTKQDTKALKGIAVILMIMLHLWAFPERIAGSLNYVISLFGQTSLHYFGCFGNICVDIFFFLGGYGLYISSKGKKFDLIIRIKKLYISYWKVFLIFIPVAFLLFSNQMIYTADVQICTRFNGFNLTYLVANFFALESTYNSEWWFVKSYAIAILSYPVINAILEKHNSQMKIFFIIILSILNNTVLPNVGNIECLGCLNNDRLYTDFIRQVAPFVSSFWMGIACAQGGLLDQINNLLKENKMTGIIFDILAWFMVSFMRQVSCGPSFGFLYTPILIVVTIDIFIRAKFIKNVFERIGRQSTNMWLIHTFYCYYFGLIAKFIVKIKWAVPCLVILILMSYFSGILVDLIWKYISKVEKYILLKSKCFLCWSKKNG